MGWVLERELGQDERATGQHILKKKKKVEEGRFTSFTSAALTLTS